MALVSSKQFRVFYLQNLEKQDGFINPLQAFESAEREDATGAVDMLSSQCQYLKRMTIGNQKGQMVWAKRDNPEWRLDNSEEVCRGKERKVSETITGAFGRTEELLLCKDLANNFVDNDAQTGRLYELKEELCEVQNEAEESNTGKIYLKKFHQEAKRTCDDAFATLRHKSDTASKKLLGSSERLIIVCEGFKGGGLGLGAHISGKNGISERCLYVLLVVQQTMKARDERNDTTTDAPTQLCLLYEEAQKEATPPQVADIVDLRRRGTKLEGRWGRMSCSRRRYLD